MKSERRRAAGGTGHGALDRAIKGGDRAPATTSSSVPCPAVGRGRGRARTRVGHGGGRLGERLAGGRRRQGHLQGRLERRAGQHQPAHRLHVAGVRDLVPHLRLARRLRPGHARADEGRGVHRSRHRLVGERRRPHLDVHHPQRRHLARRRAAHRQGRRLHLQLHHPERDGELDRLHQPHRDGDGDRRHHRGVRVLQAQAGHDPPLRAHPARARLVQDRPQEGGAAATERAALRGLRPLPGRGVEEGLARQARRQPRLLRRRAQDRRALLDVLHQRRHDAAGPQVGQHRRLRGPARRPAAAARERARHRGQRHRHGRLQRAGLQLLQGRAQQGPPRAQGLEVPPGAQLGRRPAEGGRRRLAAATPRRERRSSRPTTTPTPTGTGTRRRTSSTRTTRRRPARRSTRRGTPTRTATASGSTRASRSSSA